MDTNADPSYKDGFKRCIDETANVILATPVPEEIKHHFITQLKLLSLGHDSYSPLTPEYERNEFSRCGGAGYNNPNLTYTVNPNTLFPSAVSPLSSSTSPHNHHSSPFDAHPDRLSAFNSVESSRTIKQEVHSPQQQQSSNSSKGTGIWRPW